MAGAVVYARGTQRPGGYWRWGDQRGWWLLVYKETEQEEQEYSAGHTGAQGHKRSVQIECAVGGTGRYAESAYTSYEHRFYGESR